ncbi:unnamed protein product [Paramecium octaurelia]|uniref:Uncharacterized protein n=1 Tax=Paramecium octaurelia TaxID=43137 RepID=A0A8S1YK48_PAROT|nr:unnamed protein product [Paramecium octaurelia]
MGCNAQKIKTKTRDQQIETNPNIKCQNQQSKILETEQKVDRLNSEIQCPHSPQIGRKLKHMASSDELQKYLTKRQSNTQSPFKYIKNSPEQRRKLSLMNSPQL